MILFRRPWCHRVTAAFLGRRHISALYVTGDKAKENYAILTPYFDFTQRLVNEAADLQHNISARQIHSIDLDELTEYWYLYRTVQLKKSALEQRRIDIADALKKIQPKSAGVNDGDDNDLVTKYKFEGTMVRDHLKQLKEKSYHMEDVFVHKYLALPNRLHQRTPLQTEQIVGHEYTNGKSKTSSTKDHLSYVHLIEYYNRDCYFLLDTAAEFDLWLPLFCTGHFKRLGYVQFSTPDFCKSIVPQAAGIDSVLTVNTEEHEDASSSTINRMHLIGAGSMLSYLGYVAKLSVFKSVLPMRFVSTGRAYTQQLLCSPSNLLGVTQATQVQLFQALSGAVEAEQSFDETIENIVTVYGQIGETFRCCYVPAPKLGLAESMRVNFEIWSNRRSAYMTVGSLSYYGDFISKRLLFNYKDGRETKFPHIISGTVVSVPTLLAIILENNAGQLPSFDVQ